MNLLSQWIASRIDAFPKIHIVLHCMLCTLVFVLPAYASHNWIEIILLYLISIVGAQLFSMAIQQGFFAGYLNKRDLPVLVIISMYMAFACIGNTLFLRHSAHAFSAAAITSWLLCAMWCFPVEIAFLFVTSLLGKKIVTGFVPGRWRAVALSGVFFGIFLMPAVVYLIAFFPGAMSPDSIDQWYQAIGLLPLNNWHPVFHTLFTRYLLAIYYSPATIACAQMVLMSAVASQFLVFLYTQGIPVKWLLIFALVFALLPVNGVYAITLWKDVPFTISLLWLTLALLKMLQDPRFFRKMSPCIHLILALVLVALFRHNGLVVYFLTLLALLIYFFERRDGRLLGCLFISGLLLIAYDRLILEDGVIPNSPAVKLVAPVHGMAAVIQYGGMLPVEVQKQLEAIMPLHEWQGKFTDYSASAYLFNTNRVFINKLSKLQTGEALQMYASTFLCQPYYLVRDRLRGCDYLWNIAQPVDAFNSRYIVHVKANGIGLQQTGNPTLRHWLTNYLSFSNGIASIVIWRVGIYTILILLSIFFALRHHSKRSLLVFVPWIGCTISLLPSMVDQEYRYVYYVFFLFGFLWFTTFLPVRTLT